MKDEKFNKGIEGLKQAALTTTEKSAMLSRLHAYADFHKMKPAAKKDTASKWLHIFGANRYSYGTLAILLVLSTSSVSLAAEKALPGDILYPIKVNVNESVRSALTVSPESKAKWESDMIFRRVEEAETLAAQGKFDEASLMEVESRIDAHFENFSALSNKNSQPSGKMQAKSAAPAMDTARSAAPEAQTMMMAMPVEDSANIASSSEVSNQAFQMGALKTAPRKGSFNAKVEEHKNILQNIKSEGNESQNALLEKLQRKLEEKSEEGLQKGLELSVHEDIPSSEAAVIKSQKLDKSQNKGKGKNRQDKQE